MNVYLLFKWLHELAAFWFIAGIIGRQLTRAQARKSSDIHNFIALTGLAGRFETLMVIPGNMLVIVLGVIVGLLGNWPILGFLQGATKNWLLVTNFILVAGFFLVPLVYLPRGKIFEARLAEAEKSGQVTPELLACVDDPVVRWAHWGEYAALMFIVFLMALKPF